MAKQNIIGINYIEFRNIGIQVTQF